MLLFNQDPDPDWKKSWIRIRIKWMRIRNTGFYQKNTVSLVASQNEDILNQLNNFSKISLEKCYFLTRIRIQIRNRIRIEKKKPRSESAQNVSGSETLILASAHLYCTVGTFFANKQSNLYSRREDKIW
jgi:hypothetical protein